jgi:hypothetical protein
MKQLELEGEIDGKKILIVWRSSFGAGLFGDSFGVSSSLRRTRGMFPNIKLILVDGVK